MRTFIAIDLPGNVKDELVKVQEQFKSIVRAKFVEKENFHLTLKFLGELSDYQVNQVKEALRKIKFEKFQATLGSCGFFSPSFIRVLWVALEPRDKFFELHKKIEEALSSLNLKKENGKFESHVTLARIKSIEKEKFLRKIKEVEVKPLVFDVKAFSLKKSTLTEKGPIYEDILKFGLD
ncbi:MAG: RNA 2',3'-cyclic phosphodiesterase [Candidatus Pacearchaeota archaeon]